MSRTRVLFDLPLYIIPSIEHGKEIRKKYVKRYFTLDERPPRLIPDTVNSLIKEHEAFQYANKFMGDCLDVKFIKRDFFGNHFEGYFLEN